MKILIRALVFLAAMFLVIYIAMHNTADISFRFPLLLDKDIKQPAAILYFGVFAIGVLAGLMIHGGGKEAKAKSSSGGDSGKKK